MNIEKRINGEVIIVEISGILDTGTSPRAQEAIDKYLEDGKNKMVINIGKTEYMSSSGLRVLLATAKKLWSIDGKFRICQPNKIVSDILDTSGFSVIMEVMDSEEEALQGL